MSQSFWDAAYDIDGYKYGTAPNHFLRIHADRLPNAGKILLPGDGEGRNAVWLASRGHEVTSVDNSAIGLQKATAWARQQGVMIETIQADLAQWQPRTDHYDAVVLTYLHFAEDLRRIVHRKLLTALKVGGLLILEAFHPNQLDCQSGGPKSAQMLYRLDDIVSDFYESLDILTAWEGEILLEEGLGHQGPAFVTRYLGLKHARVSR